MIDNIQEIIESGKLELYVLNALPRDEMAQIEVIHYWQQTGYKSEHTARDDAHTISYGT